MSEPIKSEKPCCGETRVGYTCTRKSGHKGDHVAHGVGGKKLFRWRVI